MFGVGVGGRDRGTKAFISGERRNKRLKFPGNMRINGIRNMSYQNFSLIW